MQNTESTRFSAYVEANSRPDAWEKRKMLFRPLSEGKYSSISLLVRSVDGNTRDRVWVADAIEAGIIVRDSGGNLCFSEEPAPEPIDAVFDALWALGDDEMSAALDKALRAAHANVQERRQ